MTLRPWKEGLVSSGGFHLPLEPIAETTFPVEKVDKKVVKLVHDEYLDETNVYCYE